MLAGHCLPNWLASKEAWRSPLRIGIFLSVLNVHVNRAPAAFQVLTKHYRAGKYLDARSKECAKENEAMTIAGYATVNDEEFPMAVRQISGSRLRRIVCDAEKGDFLKKGRKYGMIHYGFRTELYLPAKTPVTITANTGERVTAGKSILAVFSREKQD